MEIPQIIFTTISILGYIFCIWLFYRNNQVYKFRDKVRQLSYEYSIANLDKPNAFDWFFGKLPSYYFMIKGIKPLKLKDYFTEKEINEIFNL